MGWSFNTFIVDWDAIIEAAKASGADSIWDFIDYDLKRYVYFSKHSAVIVHEDVMLEIGHFSNGKITIDAGTKYDRLREKLAPPAREAWDAILGALFWWGDEGEVTGSRDHLDEPDFPFNKKYKEVYGSLSAQRVVDLLGRALAFPPETLRPAYEEAALEFASDFGDSGWLRGYDQFIGYLKVWTGLLQRASDLGRGVALLNP